MNKVPKAYCRESGHWQTSGFHGQLWTRVSVHCGGAMTEWAHQQAEAGLRVAGPEAEAVV
ncbi:uncharacterized protein PGTG_20960 [Puccinia graminis f. sp. tritici CRL 75-36-700-3]|uniref:Uncharacterized protein n=1 Tax=Puccinia graminis f. sp. tritici (strain CRL 75-36-700-3 / race SCCL) TaxID=418459 RepID=H6QQ14_PUCGT|nr:uncharacterized protein PGTG_20960 [Puccinia graminis f. sp. tritici CRL 75-36-700-3]EHS64497.1 hypothetical protein PGTG_20960 [Puccinia graminis f. sp. tritici CRL 75-36-700-3]